MRGGYQLSFDDDGQNVANVASNSAVAARADFLKKTYAHVFGAVLAFVAIEAVMFKSGFAEEFLKTVFARGKFGYLAMMVLFIGAGYVAQMLAAARSRPLAYAGLAGYVLVECLVLLPLLYVSEKVYPGQDLALKAGMITLLVFGGLTSFVFISGKDFSFLGPIITVLSFAALGLVVASVLFGFSLGLVFAVAMVVLAAGMIVYDTSNIMHHYSTDDYVPAALSLFASLATMFFYVLRILMSLQSRD
ncbi:MAG: Bax inhibitor-1/YccA family protein [Fimbriiglobus sp.]